MPKKPGSSRIERNAGTGRFVTDRKKPSTTLTEPRKPKKK